MSTTPTLETETHMHRYITAAYVTAAAFSLAFDTYVAHLIVTAAAR